MRWESYQKQLTESQEKFSEEAVHQLRVATRRLIAQFVMLDGLTPGTMARKARRMLKRRLKALGELRDLQVQRLFLGRQVVRFPELILLRDFLRRREKKLQKVAANRVKGFKTRNLERWTMSLERHLLNCSPHSRQAQGLADKVAAATSQAFAEVVRRRRAVNPAVPGTVHRTRIAFKKFRYMVEALSPDCTGFDKRRLRTLAHYQRRMGILQDLEVMQRSVSGFVQQHPGMTGLLKPFTRYLRASRARALRSFLKSADAIYDFWPPQSAETSSVSPPAAAAA